MSNFGSFMALILAFGLVSAVHSAAMTSDRSTLVTNAKAAILASIKANNALGPKYLRLVFHDCVSSNGCDGCVNQGQADNKGLDVPINALEAIYKPSGVDTQYSKGMSRADFWALAGIVCIEWGVVGGQFGKDPTMIDWQGIFTMKDIKFTMGRKDCAASPNNVNNAEDPLIDAKKTSTKQLFDYFWNTIGFNRPETNIIMGAHSFGKATKVNSHIADIVWTSDAWRDFDNGYMHSIFEPLYDWRQNSDSTWTCFDFGAPGEPNFPAFVGNCGGDMFNVDMEIMIDVTPDANGMVNDCIFKTKANGTQFRSSAKPLCTVMPDMHALMHKHDVNATLYANDFAEVYTKLIDLKQSWAKSSYGPYGQTS